ncbi:MAG: hypothetical protein ACTSSQ_03270 [Alphaproteobacteria bacterium]
MSAMDHRLARKSLEHMVSCLSRNFAGRFFIIDGTLLGLIR